MLIVMSAVLVMNDKFCKQKKIEQNEVHWISVWLLRGFEMSEEVEGQSRGLRGEATL